MMTSLQKKSPHMNMILIGLAHRIISHLTVASFKGAHQSTSHRMRKDHQSTSHPMRKDRQSTSLLMSMDRLSARPS